MPKNHIIHSLDAFVDRRGYIADNASVMSQRLPLHGAIKKQMPSAIIYCEANFGGIDGKTANGLVRHSERYKILSVIDSKQAGHDAGLILGGKQKGIPIFSDLTEALEHAGKTPDFFIYGMAPASGLLSLQERGIILKAIRLKMNIINGMHEFLSDDPEFSAAAADNRVTIRDVRKPRERKNLRTFNGSIAQVTCPRIAVLGTDCAIGKRTTSTILTQELKDQGIKAIMIGTGQTGLIQGARYGVALDAIPSQFCAGELEATIVEAFENENPDVIIIEGQGALSHPAYSTSSFILRGSCPDGVILQHAPGRSHRCDFEHMTMPSPDSEISLIQSFSDTKVIGLTINHEQMTDAEIDTAITRYENSLGILVTDPLARPERDLAEMVLSTFPKLGRSRITGCQ
ncbi:MAG: DUF1611 domain-containing protein [Magnetococcales bacterium]|nr:DUF1611 domain-containing protein [Magnetococcales bacterium]